MMYQKDVQSYTYVGSSSQLTTVGRVMLTGSTGQLQLERSSCLGSGVNEGSVCPVIPSSLLTADNLIDPALPRSIHVTFEAMVCDVYNLYLRGA